MTSQTVRHRADHVRRQTRHRPPSHRWSPELQRDLESLEARYAEHAKHFDSALLDYGPIDPLGNVGLLVFPDAATGRQPQVTRSSDGQVHLLLDGVQLTNSARHEWEAICEWNRDPRAKLPRLSDFPFFFLPSDPDLARPKVSAMRRHLEMRTRLEKLRLMSGRQVGSSFLNRLKAYRCWADIGQKVVRVEAKLLA